MPRLISLSTTLISLAALTAPARSEDATPPDHAVGEVTAATAVTSLAVPPAVTLFRGGSLGVPAPTDTRAIEAGTTLKLDNPSDGSAVDFDFMAKVGGLNLYDTVLVDIVGEQYQQALPVVTLGGPTALPTMTSTSVKSAGLRVVLRRGERTFDVRRARAFDRSLSSTNAGARAAQRVFAATSGDWYGFGLRALHPSLPGADEASLRGFATEFTWQRITNFDVSDECKQELEAAATRANEEVVAATKRVEAATSKLAKAKAAFDPAAPEGFSTLLDPGKPAETAKLLAELVGRDVELTAEKSAAEAARRTASQRAKAIVPAAAAPKSVCGASRRHTYFASLSATYLNSQRLTPDGLAAVAMPAVTEVRVAGGAELQSGTRLGKYLLPRLGAYAAVSGARWDNAFAMSGASDPVIEWQAELALYTSGHFTGGFSGVFSIGVLVPYGDDAEPQAFINIAPTVGAPLGGS